MTKPTAYDHAAWVTDLMREAVQNGTPEELMTGITSAIERQTKALEASGSVSEEEAVFDVLTTACSAVLALGAMVRTLAAKEGTSTEEAIQALRSQVMTDIDRGVIPGLVRKG